MGTHDLTPTPASPLGFLSFLTGGISTGGSLEDTPPSVYVASLIDVASELQAPDLGAQLRRVPGV